MAVVIPAQYGYVLLAASSTFFVNTLHAMRTGKFRKASGIDYPISYATEEQASQNPKAFLFNCAQRAHANFTENHTSTLGAILVAGVQFPVAAASLGGAWALGRILYLYGYTSNSGPKGRLPGSAVSGLTDLALKGLAVWGAVQVITQ